jgi:translation initiation factor IF-2
MGAYQSDMVWLSRISEAEIERALAGEYAGEDPSLRTLASYAKDVRSTLSAAPDEATRATHLVSMAQATAGLHTQPAAQVRPAPARAFNRAKLVLTSLAATLIGKIALVGVALAATTGGLAATGSLPDPAQDAVARAGEKVGLELPRGDDRVPSDDDGGVPEDLPGKAQGSSAPSVLDVIRSWEVDKGCEFGHAVAAAAGGHPVACTKERGDDDGRDKRGKQEARGGRPDDAGRPEGTPQGKPAGAGEGKGKPEGTPGKPEGVGKTEGTPDGKPEGAGKPEKASGGGSSRPGGTGSGNSDHGTGPGSRGGVGPPSEVPAGGSGDGLPNSVPGAKP